MPAMEAPSFDVVRVEKSGETVIAGRAAPDSEVNVTTQDGSSLGRTKADASGAWAIVPEQPLTPGSHEIGVESQNAEGAAALSEEVVVVVVPEPQASAAPAPKAAATKSDAGSDTTGPAAGGEQVLAVLTPRQGGGSKVLPQEPEEGIVHGDLVLDSVDYNEDGIAVVGGRAAPGSRVVIYLDNRLLGDSVAGVDGRWSYAPKNPVAEGLHQLRVDQVDGSGKVIARVETPFSRQAVRVASADEAFVIVQPGNSLWRIARRTYGHGLQYSVIYQANKDQIRDPDLIYPGQVFELPTTN
jgi:nucleoid-associated protein YgaU